MILKDYLNMIAPQAAQKNINIEILKEVEILVPPLSIQAEIVAQIEREQSLVNANKELIGLMEAKRGAADVGQRRART